MVEMKLAEMGAEPLLTVAEAARRLSVSERYIRDAINAGSIDWVDLARGGERACPRVAESVLRAYIADRRQTRRSA